ncbi:MAG: hypothetical protein BWX84_00362 [Verrucomicrobia bacterium ADurb.Bin118]|jgi:hypothetical protein|nr:MAG: hypothetical protein BWX84_00362 [Verrucomicrobia bacterium ADurb.Bin118]
MQTNTMASPSQPRWQFFRAGGFDQVKLESGADLMHLDQLDQKLWVALACPTTGLEFDAKTAALIDTNQDGRIRAPELIAAVKWAGARLKNPDHLIKGGDVLPLAAINDATEEGGAILASAQQILTNLGKKDADAISLADASDANKIFADTVLNGDGVILPESAKDKATQAVITEIADCLGTVMDRSGKPGIDQAKVDAFFTECADYEAWIRQSESEAATILPAGEATAAAAAAVQAIKAKVDDFFGRCRLAAFDSRAVAILNRKEEEYLAVAAQDLSITAEEIASFPLAQVAPGKPLPLKGAVNPAHAAALATLQTDAVKPLLGDKAELTEADWAALQARLAPYATWSAAKTGANVEKLGVARIREILGSKAKETIAALIADDLALEPQATGIANVEKLCRYVRDLHKLCINFVNFRDFYDNDDEPATFQAGTLYLDQRACRLCLPVDDAGKHASMAALAGTYLAYCDCVRKGTDEKRQIVAAFTNGDADNLMVGRNGLFYDRQGRDWDATITKIVDNPISIRQAFWAPYKKLVRLIEEQVAKRAAAADDAATAKLESTAATAANVDKAKPAEPKKVDVGAVAAMGVAFGFLMTAFATIAGYATGLLKLPFWQVCLAVVGLLLLISGPSMLIAWLKLRKRNLGPILDANGWAVNAKARINVPFGASLTSVAELPPGASITADKFGERPSAWPKFALVVVIIGFIYSLLNHYYLIDQMTGGKWGKKPPADEQVDRAGKAGQKDAAEAPDASPAS